eukprot:13463-Heterococcus_DN1.PRE.1
MRYKHLTLETLCYLQYPCTVASQTTLDFYEDFGSVLAVCAFPLCSCYAPCLLVESSMSSKKRGAASATSPLEDAGILLHVLQILGPGQHLLISAVSKAWRDIYARVPEVTMAQLTHSYDDQAFPCTIDSQTTLCSALFASATSFNWACACGLDLESDSIESIERVAGR